MRLDLFAVLRVLLFFLLLCSRVLAQTAFEERDELPDATKPTLESLDAVSRPVKSQPAVNESASESVDVAQAPTDAARKANPLSGWEDVLNRDAAVSGLSSRDKKMAVEAFLRPYQSGRWDIVVNNIRKQLSRREMDEVGSLSTYLESNDSPSLATMATQSRLQLGRSGVTNIPPPNSIESVLLGDELARILDRKIDDLRGIQLMQSPLEDPQDFLVYRDLIWERHVHSNEFANAMKIANQGLAIQREATKRLGKNDAAMRADLNKHDFAKYRMTLRDLRRDMDQRALEVRVNRVEHAVDVLEDRAASVGDRFFAAYVVGVDSESLVSEIKKGKGKFTRPTLQATGLAGDLEIKLRRASKSAGDLTEKSRLLFAGLHWWRRGRYGMGTDAFGLLKSKLAIRNPQLRLALMMPRETPVPTNPFQASQNPIPNYQRRHLFFWAYEDRVFSSLPGRKNRKVVGQETRSKEMPLVDKHFDGMINDKFW